MPTLSPTESSNKRIRAIPELMAQPKEAREDCWIMEMLQNAIELEFSTIPPYLCAWWSIKSATNPNPDEVDPVAKSIKIVWREEMGHMGLMCNLLAGIGGKPNLKMVPKYPGPLPGNVHPGLIAKLQGLSYDSLRLFMEIELPQFGPLAARLRANIEYPTIGAFYTAIEHWFQINTFILDASKQIAVQPGVFVMRTLTDVERAIEKISREGEGSEMSPEDTGPTDLAHYYRFGEVFYGRKPKKHPVTGEWHFNGDPVPFPDVWPVAPTPPQGFLENEVSPPVWALLRHFDETFTKMLEQLQMAWDNHDISQYGSAILTMKSLSPIAVDLIQRELPTRNGNYGPCFRLL